MFEVFLICVVSVLAIIGFSELVHTVCKAVLKPQRSAKHILYLIPTVGFAQQQIALALHEMRWYGNDYAQKLVVCTRALQDLEITECRERFCGADIVFLDKDFKG